MCTNSAWIFVIILPENKKDPFDHHSATGHLFHNITEEADTDECNWKDYIEFQYYIASMFQCNSLSKYHSVFHTFP